MGFTQQLISDIFLTNEIACNAGVEATKEITVVDKVKHGEYYVEAVWPLGSAIEAVSTKKMA